MTKLVRYKPERDIWDVPSIFDRVRDEFLAPFRSEWFGFPARWGGLWQDEFFNFFAGDNLAVDIYEDDDAVVVKAALPGTALQDIEVEEQEGLLTIRARREENLQRDQSGWRVRAQRYGAWQRTVRLPVEVRGEKAKAELRDGILTVRLPKVEPHKKLVNRIKINLPKLSLPKLGDKERKIKVSHN